jgi:hypothetical protein
MPGLSFSNELISQDKGLHCYLASWLCIPSEFRRIPTEVGRTSPAGMECDSSRHRNSKCYLRHSGPFRLVLVYEVPTGRKCVYLLYVVSQYKSKCGKMKTLSAWWFSWYAAERTENATTNHRRERRRFLPWNDLIPTCVPRNSADSAEKSGFQKMRPSRSWNAKRNAHPSFACGMVQAWVGHFVTPLKRR